MLPDDYLSTDLSRLQDMLRSSDEVWTLLRRLVSNVRDLDERVYALEQRINRTIIDVPLAEAVLPSGWVGDRAFRGRSYLHGEYLLHLERPTTVCLRLAGNYRHRFIELSRILGHFDIVPPGEAQHSFETINADGICLAKEFLVEPGDHTVRFGLAAFTFQGLDEEPWLTDTFEGWIGPSTFAQISYS